MPGRGGEGTVLGTLLKGKKVDIRSREIQSCSNRLTSKLPKSHQGARNNKVVISQPLGHVLVHRCRRGLCNSGQMGRADERLLQPRQAKVQFACKTLTAAVQLRSHGKMIFVMK